MEKGFCLLSCVNLLLGLSLRTPQQRPNLRIFGPSDSKHALLCSPPQSSIS